MLALELYGYQEQSQGNHKHRQELPVTPHTAVDNNRCRKNGADNREEKVNYFEGIHHVSLIKAISTGRI